MGELRRMAAAGVQAFTLDHLKTTRYQPAGGGDTGVRTGVGRTHVLNTLKLEFL